jgi:two-component system OmpR family response regulator
MLKILVVEDNEDISAALSEILKYSLDCEIDIVTSESQAAEYTERHQSDFTIIDVMLHDGNGISLLKQMAPFKSGEWIIFSNHSKADLQKMCFEFGADYVFDKSNELDSLVNLLIKKNNARVV